MAFTISPKRKFLDLEDSDESDDELPDLKVIFEKKNSSGTCNEKGYHSKKIKGEPLDTAQTSLQENDKSVNIVNFDEDEVFSDFFDTIFGSSKRSLLPNPPSRKCDKRGNVRSTPITSLPLNEKNTSNFLNTDNSVTEIIPVTRTNISNRSLYKKQVSKNCTSKSRETPTNMKRDKKQVFKNCNSNGTGTPRETHSNMKPHLRTSPQCHPDLIVSNTSSTSGAATATSYKTNMLKPKVTGPGSEKISQEYSPPTAHPESLQDANLNFLKIFLKEFASMKQRPQISQVMCKHLKLDDEDTVCPTCCWPEYYSHSFNNEDIQKEMLEKIMILKKGKNLPNVYIAKFLIRYFSKDVQNQIKELLPHFFAVNPSEVEEEEEHEELGHAETFSDYKPAKLTIGKSHPDSVVETASLSSVEPPDITYKLSIPDSVIVSGKLSALQLETITYACQRYEHSLSNGVRAGFLIGDGAGVGKGRTIAGVIYENFLKGFKKSVWISISNDLKYDAERDLSDISADIKVHYLYKIPYGKIDIEDGVLFATYSALVGHTRGHDSCTRLQQIVDWCGKEFEGCIVFDECHKAKNLIASGGRKPTKTGLAVLNLQEFLPKARIFYASATGASEPKDMGYMTRLGIWGEDTPFRYFSHFKSAVDRRGVGAMEVIALDMKLRGAYLARQLSFQGVTFHIEEVKLTDEYKKAYDDSSKLWIKTLKYYEILDALINDKKRLKLMWALFWAAHQRFFKYLCIGAKVKHVVELSKKAIAEGKCVVLGLQMTGEAAINAILKEEGEIINFVSTARSVLQTVIEKFSEADLKKIGIHGTDGAIDPAALKEKFSNKENLNTMLGKKGKVSQAIALRQSLIEDLKILGPNLPPSTLDDLIHHLGGPQNVAEMTGRKGRVTQLMNGEIGYTSRCEPNEELDMVNMNEKKRFMDGEKNVAIISEAASSGISLQSDKRVPNTKRRVHITLELPWSADRAIQQFGRTHRSNQVSAPQYIFVISELAGERRFASVVAKRLESLGALTHGDRRAAETRDLSHFNIDNKYGSRALRETLEAITRSDDKTPLVPPPLDYQGNFFEDLSKALVGVGITSYNDVDAAFSSCVKESKNVSRFLNRILGLPVVLQNSLFDYFMATYDAVIREEKRLGKYDLGILDLGIGGQSCLASVFDQWKTKHSTGESQTTLYKVQVTRGISWNEATVKYNSNVKNTYEGFYISNFERRGNRYILLAILDSSGTNRFMHKRFQPYVTFRPNTGQGKRILYHELVKKYKKVLPNDAKRHWVRLYEHTKKRCAHSFWTGFCNAASTGQNCTFGMLNCTYYILCGAVLSVWTCIENVFSGASKLNSKVQVIRLKTKDGQKLVGTHIPNALVAKLCNALNKMKDSNMNCLKFEEKSGAGSSLTSILEKYDETYMASSQRTSVPSTTEQSRPSFSVGAINKAAREAPSTSTTINSNSSQRNEGLSSNNSFRDICKGASAATDRFFEEFMREQRRHENSTFFIDEINRAKKEDTKQMVKNEVKQEDIKEDTKQMVKSKVKQEDIKQMVKNEVKQEPGIKTENNEIVKLEVGAKVPDIKTEKTTELPPDTNPKESVKWEIDMQKYNNVIDTSCDLEELNLFDEHIRDSQTADSFIYGDTSFGSASEFSGFDDNRESNLEAKTDKFSDIAEPLNTDYSNPEENGKNGVVKHLNDVKTTGVMTIPEFSDQHTSVKDEKTFPRPSKDKQKWNRDALEESSTYKQTNDENTFSALLNDQQTCMDLPPRDLSNREPEARNIGNDATIRNEANLPNNEVASILENGEAARVPETWERNSNNNAPAIRNEANLSNDEIAPNVGNGEGGRVPDTEDLCCIIDIKCDLREVKQMLGIPEGKRSNRSGWKASLKELHEDIQMLKQFVISKELKTKV